MRIPGGAEGPGARSIEGRRPGSQLGSWRGADLPPSSFGSIQAPAEMLSDVLAGICDPVLTQMEVWRRK